MASRGSFDRFQSATDWQTWDRVTSRQTIVERAFDLARSGACRDLADIHAQLRADGYTAVAAHLEGRGIRRQLLAVLRSH